MKYQPIINVGTPYSPARIRQENIYTVLNMLSKAKIEADLASPNFVVNFARNRNIPLDSESVVEISNKYEG